MQSPISEELKQKILAFRKETNRLCNISKRISNNIDKLCALQQINQQKILNLIAEGTKLREEYREQLARN